MNLAILLNEWWICQLAILQADTCPLRRPRASTRIPLSEAAKVLGVTREHLSRVLHGHRQSKSLTKRFRELERKGAA